MFSLNKLRTNSTIVSCRLFSSWKNNEEKWKMFERWSLANRWEIQFYLRKTDPRKHFYWQSKNSFWSWRRRDSVKLEKISISIINLSIFIISSRIDKIIRFLLRVRENVLIFFQWIEPDAAIKGYRENQIDFLPPQIVELSSLANFAKISDLKHFLTKRSDSPDYSTKRKLGICFKVRDGVALVLPGDDFYPPDSSFETPVFVLDKTLADFECPNKNRLVTRKDDPNRRWSIEFRRDSSKVRSEFDVFPLSTDDQIRSNLWDWKRKIFENSSWFY